MKKEETRQIESVIFEGMTSINAVLRSAEATGARKILSVYVDRERLSKKHREFAFLKASSAQHGFELIVTDKDHIESLAIGTSHGGIIAKCTERVIPKLDTLVPKADGFYIMIDGIEDPYNFGYALRSVYASGADGVVLTERNWMTAAGVVCRSSAGASELIESYVSEPAAACDFFRESGYKVVCADIRDSVSVYDADMKKPLFLVVGGEKRGISTAVKEKCDFAVRLDYGRVFNGSLSAASSASILAYEVLRQNR